MLFPPQTSTVKLLPWAQPGPAPHMYARTLGTRAARCTLRLTPVRSGSQEQGCSNPYGLGLGSPHFIWGNSPLTGAPLLPLPTSAVLIGVIGPGPPGDCSFTLPLLSGLKGRLWGAEGQ